MRLCSTEHPDPIHFLVFPCLPQNLLLEYLYFSPNAESLYDDDVIIGALLTCFAPLSVDCVLTPILECAMANHFCALMLFTCDTDLLFFGHRPKCFSNDQNKFCHCGQNN